MSATAEQHFHRALQMTLDGADPEEVARAVDRAMALQEQADRDREATAEEGAPC